MLAKFNIYDILTKITTGSLLLGVLILQYFKLLKPLIIELKIVPESILVVIIFSLIYFLGLVINRLGSIALEPLLTCLKLINMDNYATFVKAEKVNSRLTTLSQEYGVSRTYATLWLVLLILFLVNLRYQQLSWQTIALVSIILAFLFLEFVFSAQKHSSKINDVVKDYKE